MGGRDVFHGTSLSFCVAPDWIVPYRTRLPNRSTVRGAVHFFLYDALFESVWNAPNKSAQYLTRFTVLFSPDFSLYPEMPLSVQLTARAGVERTGRRTGTP